MTDRADLTTADRATLATIEAILGGDDPPPDADRALAAFAAGLRDSAPQADTAFRQRLRADVVAAASAAQAERAAPWWRRRLTRRQAVAAGIAAVGLGGATVAVSAVKALVRGSASGEGTSGWSLDQTGPQLLVHGKDGVRRIGPDDALFEYLIFQVQQERWQQFEQFPSQREPQAKSLVRLSNGWQFPIPAYLPAGFKWQGFSAMYDRDKDIGRLGNAGIGSGGGGGSGLPWERMPEFDPRLSAHLLGGDPADRFLLLSQFRPGQNPNVNLTISQIDVPGRTPQPYGGPSGAPTRMPTTLAYYPKLVDLFLVRPAMSGPSITVSIGASAVQDVLLGTHLARQYYGVWGLDGQWIDTTDWCTLVWVQDGYLYHLAAQQVPLAELVRVAESLPTAP